MPSRPQNSAKKSSATKAAQPKRTDKPARIGKRGSKKPTGVTIQTVPWEGDHFTRAEIRKAVEHVVKKYKLKKRK